MKIVFLDAKTIGDDIDLSGYEELGEVVKYDFSSSEEVPARVIDADVLVLNKVQVNEHTIGTARNLKLVCVTATGTNNLDKDYLDRRNIAWRNVAEERYVGDTIFTHFAERFCQIHGKTWGIIGLGNIGRRVADIAKAFGANVIYYSTSGSNTQDGYTRTDFVTLLATSDIISVHAPLTPNTEHLIDAKALSKMKPSAIFLNLGRGPIVVEEDLADALESGQIAAAGLDVLCTEPMCATNPLLRIKDSKKLLITPHIAWASVEARTSLMNIILGQIQDWKNKYPPA